MSDTTTVWDTATGYGDWALQGVQLQAGDDLQTAVLISLFTDAQADSDDVVPDGSGDVRGWWGDTGADYPIGSKLWLLSRAKQTQETLNLAQDYIQDALQWLIDDGVAASIDVVTEWTRPSVLGMQVTIYKTDGTQAALKYAAVWKGVL